MGSITTAAIADSVADWLADVRQALSWHLTGNFFPPLPADKYVEPLLEAIDHCVAEDYNAVVVLPIDTNPVPRTATREPDGWHVTASNLVDACRSWEFVSILLEPDEEGGY